MRRLTFIKDNQAKEGLLFIYEGDMTKCIDCLYEKVCHNLTSKTIYSVSVLRDKIVDCKTFGCKMRLVEVNPAEIKVAVEPKMAIEGATLEFKPQQCLNLQCEKLDECAPPLADLHGKFKVVKIYGKFQCPISQKKLVRILLAPQEKL